MPTYVALVDWTEQGVRNFKDTVDRYEAAESAFESLGVRFTDIRWTLGAHDMVAMVEAADDESLAASRSRARRDARFRDRSWRDPRIAAARMHR